MTALSFIGEGTAPRRGDRELRPLAIGLLPTALLATTALLMLWRRWVGALTVPPTFPAAAAYSVAALGLVLAAQFAARRWCRGPDVVRPWRRILDAAAVVRFAAVALPAAALTLPGTTLATIAMLWVPVAAPVMLNAYLWLRGPSFVGGRRASSSGGERPLASARRLRQQVTRFVDAAGRDVVEGTAVALFAAGQRSVSIHLAFCPPFARSPEVACGVASEVQADVKPAQVLPYAARFDVKLATVTAAAVEVPVSFSARCDR